MDQDLIEWLIDRQRDADKGVAECKPYPYLNHALNWNLGRASAFQQVIEFLK